jgi:hypothetical protein
MEQIYKLSGMSIVGAGTTTGTIQLQVSLDIPTNGAPINFTDFGTPLSIIGAGNTLIAATDMCYRWIRAKFTSTFANVTTFTAVADISDSLNSKYILASNTTGDFYIWLTNGTGIDPAIAGRTGIAVTFTTNDTANTIASLIRTAAAGNGWTVTGATNQVILTNNPVGPSAIGAIGNSGFAVVNTQPTGNITLKIACQGF